jgi:hypothetical protein
MKMKDVLYVPSLTKNLLSISTLDKKFFRVAFIDGEVVMWPNVVALKNMHTCKRELSPAHLVCPRRHNV